MSQSIVKTNKNFRSPFDSIRVTSENCSDFLIDTYDFDVSKYGEAKIVKTGKIDIYQEIQSHKDTCDLKVVLAEVKATGDMSKLNNKKAVYGDLSNMPSNFVDVQNLVKSTNKKIKEELTKSTGVDFTSMTDEEFKKFDVNSLNVYLQNKIMEKLTKVKSVVNKSVVEKKEENK